MKWMSAGMAVLAGFVSGGYVWERRWVFAVGWALIAVLWFVTTIIEFKEGRHGRPRRVGRDHRDSGSVSTRGTGQAAGEGTDEGAGAGVTVRQDSVPILGYKHAGIEWRSYTGFRFTGFNGCEYGATPEAATHFSGYEAGHSSAPQVGCECGWNAWREPVPPTPFALEVELFGTVHSYERGYRSSHMRVIAVRVARFCAACPTPPTHLVNTRVNGQYGGWWTHEVRCAEHVAGTETAWPLEQVETNLGVPFIYERAEP